MKKRYESPMVAVERFEMSQHIASCASIKISYTGPECVMNDPDATPGMKTLALQMYFLDTASGCINLIRDGETFDGVCYHTSSAMAFTS